MRREEGAHLLPLPLSVSCRGAAAAASAACLPFRRRRSEIPRGHASSRLGPPPPPPLPAGWSVAQEGSFDCPRSLLGQSGEERATKTARLATVLSADDDANCVRRLTTERIAVDIRCSKMQRRSIWICKLCQVLTTESIHRHSLYCTFTQLSHPLHSS